MLTVAVARYAMATRFEIVLHGDNEVALRAAGEEALDEIERIEAQLSLYRPSSQIAHVNARAAFEPVCVDPSVFHLLEQIQTLSAETKGAFDMTIAPLMRCWGFMRDTGRVPDAAELAAARSRVGSHLVRLNPKDRTVAFACEGVMLDLGAVGKGYAIEQAAAILRDAGVLNAILHGGTSTVFGLGTAPEGKPWNIAVEYPPSQDETPGELLAAVPLNDEALSVSAVWGKSFQTGERRYGHVIDPRTGEPTSGTLLAAAILPSAMETDALSTALLVGGVPEFDKLATLRPGMRALVLEDDKPRSGWNVRASGLTIRPAAASNKTTGGGCDFSL